LDYLARVDDATSASAGDLSFFKIDQKGLNDAATQSWASDDLIADGNAWTVTVPKDIAPGQYVLRHEIIALHSAQDANGAQSYPQCINIEVTGSGTAEPEAVAATKLYGISLSIYNDLTSYEIPGPAVYSGGASGSAPSTGGSSSAASSASATKVAPAASSATVASSSAPFSNSSSASATSESYPEPTAEPTFAGEAESTPCTTTITLTGSSAATAAATQTSSPVETSDNSDDNSGDNSSSDNSSSGSSNNTPTTTSAPVAVISAVASSLPSSVLNAPIPTATSSSDSDDGKPSKPLPAGFTLADLLEWVNYLLKKAMSTDSKHARDVVRR
jgi:cellulase